MSSLEAWGNFLTLCPCMGDFSPTPASTNHQNRVNSVLCPFWLLLCCNCGTQIIKGPKSRFLLLPPQSVHYFWGWMEVAPSMAGSFLENKGRNISQGILGPSTALIPKQTRTQQEKNIISSISHEHGTKISTKH